MNVSTKITSACLMSLLMTSCHKEKAATVQEPLRVDIMAVGTTEVTQGRTYSGTVEESTGTALSFATAGTINTVNVNVGDRVAKGQLIATVDGSSLQNAYAITQATLNQAQDTYNRMKQLHEANALPDIKWVEAQNALKSAQSAAAIARKGLSDASLYAPQSGYVSQKYMDAGMNVAPGVPVVKIVDISKVKVSIPVPENEIASVSDNASATITVGALGGKQFTGRLVEKGVSANSLSRTYSVKFEVDNTSGDLLPGMVCDVAIDNAQSHQALTLPIDAVLLDADNQNFVWIADEGKARKQIVKVGGFTSGTQLIINEGLEQGDSVIVKGQQKVSNGTPVINIDSEK